MKEEMMKLMFRAFASKDLDRIQQFGVALQYAQNGLLLRPEETEQIIDEAMSEDLVEIEIESNMGMAMPGPMVLTPDDETVRLHELGHVECGHVDSIIDALIGELPVINIIHEVQASRWAIERGADGGRLAGALQTYLDDSLLTKWGNTEGLAKYLLGVDELERFDEEVDLEGWLETWAEGLPPIDEAATHAAEEARDLVEDVLSDHLPGWIRVKPIAWAVSHNVEAYVRQL